MIDAYQRVLSADATPFSHEDGRLSAIAAYFKAGSPSVGGYGSVEFELQEDVKQRATFTVGDSLTRFDRQQLTGAPILRPGLEAVGSAVKDYYDRGAGGVGYIEAQIQGGVSASDVRRIIIHADGPEYNWIVAEARRQGIAVVIDADYL